MSKKRKHTASKKHSSCGKRRYRDVDEVKRARAYLLKKDVPMRYYECHLCKGLHLTSMID